LVLFEDPDKEVVGLKLVTTTAVEVAVIKAGDVAAVLAAFFCKTVVKLLFFTEVTNCV
jgi:hypothetical protein